MLLVQPYHPQFEIDYYFPDHSFEGIPREYVPALPLMEGVRPIELQEFLDAQKSDPSINKLRAQVLAQNLKIDPQFSGTFTSYRALASHFNKLIIEKDHLYIKFPDEDKKLVVPEPLVDRLLELTHSGPDAAHLGYKRLKTKLALTYYWPSLRSDCRTYTQSCPTCDSFRVAPHKDPLTSTIPVGDKNQVLALDFVGGQLSLPPSK